MGPEIIPGRSNAQQREVIEDGIGTEQADVATNFDRAKPGRADRAEELAEVDAGGPETERRPSIVGIEKTDVRVVAEFVPGRPLYSSIGHGRWRLCRHLYRWQ